MADSNNIPDQFGQTRDVYTLVVIYTPIPSEIQTDQDAPAEAKFNSKVSGLDGWLWLLIIGLVGLWPLITWDEAFGIIEKQEAMCPYLLNMPAWAFYKTGIWGVFLIGFALGIMAGYRLYKVHTMGSVDFTILVLWLIGPVSALATIVFHVVLLEARPDASNVIMILVKSSIGASIWTLYLRISKRVKAVYGHSF